MITAFVLGGLVGLVAGVAVFGVIRRRREAATLADLEEIGVGQAEGISGTGSDLLTTLRRVVADAVASVGRAEEATTRFELALDRMVEGIVVCDGDGRVVFTNRAGAVLADARHEDALVAAALADGLRSALSGEPDVRSVELAGPPARTITVDARPLGAVQDRAGAVATVTDESRLRRLESVRTDFVANVSHELKTPIGGLALLAEALVDVGDPEEHERLAARLLHEAHRAGRVVDDLLELSEVEGDVESRRTRVSIDDIVDRACAQVAVMADSFGIEVDASEVQPDLVVIGDRVQLTSALTNLVENAVKYSGGSSPVVVRAAGDGELVELTVRDRGIGIPRRDLDRVFERFYRVDQARSRATGGTGLGLSIVRNVARIHGGEVELTSREGVGTAVVLRLPLAGADRRDRTDGLRARPRASGA